MALILFLACGLLPAQNNRFRVMFYNVENLFDCRHDTLKNDHDFLPDALRAWHSARLKKKLYRLSQVIVSAGEWEPPALVGLCEVENDSVMQQLVRYSPLRNCNYRYVMTRSPDKRGIDVALLWQPHRFRVLQYRSIPIYLSDAVRRPTRDILHVTGRVSTGDSLDVFVCHLPSRSGGRKASEPARMQVASVIRQQADSVMSARHNPYILIMGDFNDYPTDSSLQTVLEASAPSFPSVPHRLYNLMADKGSEYLGTYNYRGEWGILDHILVSGTLLMPGTNIGTDASQARICNFPFLLKEDERYKGLKPWRTYNGVRYEGGYSDHLPVLVDFHLR